MSEDLPKVESDFAGRQSIGQTATARNRYPNRDTSGPLVNGSHGMDQARVTGASRITHEFTGLPNGYAKESGVNSAQNDLKQQPLGASMDAKRSEQYPERGDLSQHLSGGTGRSAKLPTETSRTTQRAIGSEDEYTAPHVERSGQTTRSTSNMDRKNKTSELMDNTHRQALGETEKITEADFRRDSVLQPSLDRIDVVPRANNEEKYWNAGDINDASRNINPHRQTLRETEKITKADDQRDNVLQPSLDRNEMVPRANNEEKYWDAGDINDASRNITPRRQALGETEKARNVDVRRDHVLQSSLDRTDVVPRANNEEKYWDARDINDTGRYTIRGKEQVIDDHSLSENIHHLVTHNLTR
jgi:hypothetical protein